MIQALLTVCVLHLSFSVSAAIPYKKAANGKMNSYIADGVFTGGGKQGLATLINVRRILAKNSKIDRWIFDLGDDTGKPLPIRPAYYHVAVEGKEKRIVINLEDVTASRLDEDQIKTILKSSPYVADVSLRVDGAEKLTHLHILLKTNVEAEVFELPAKDYGGRIAVDVRPKRLAKNGK